jgi:transposase-like protein
VVNVVVRKTKKKTAKKAAKLVKRGTAAKPAHMGRRTLLTQAAERAILFAFRHQATVEIAASYIGVHPATIFLWMKKGRESASGPYHDFYEKAQKALGKRAVKDLESISNAADRKDWRAAAWRLEAWYRQDYGRRVIEHTGSVDTGPVLTVEELAQLADDPEAFRRRYRALIEKKYGDRVPAELEP